jgi:EVE domain
VRTNSSRRARPRKSSRWLLVRGLGDHPLPAAVRSEQLRSHHSTRRPTVAKGDLAICYASVWQAIFAVVEVVSDPEHDPSRERWSWRFGIRPLAQVDDLHRAPAVEEAGIFPQSLWRHSYIRLTPEQFAAARALVETASK